MSISASVPHCRHVSVTLTTTGQTLDALLRASNIIAPAVDVDGFRAEHPQSKWGDTAVIRARASAAWQYAPFDAEAGETAAATPQPFVTVAADVVEEIPVANSLRTFVFKVASGSTTLTVQLYGNKKPGNAVG